MIRQVTEAAENYNQLLSSLSSDEARMFEAPLQSLVATYLPMLTTLSWNKRYKLPSLLPLCSNAVKHVAEQVHNYSRFNDDLYRDLESIKNYRCFEIQRTALYEGDEFLGDVARQRNAIITKIRNKYGRIENELFSLYENIITQDSTKLSRSMWLSYIERVDELFLSRLKDVAVNSMLFFEKILTCSREIPEYELSPMFEVKVVLLNGLIQSCPLLDNLYQSVKHLKDVLVDGLLKVPCFIRRYDLEKSKEHIHQNEFEDGVLDNIQQKITKNYEEKIKVLTTKLSSWTQFEIIWKADQNNFDDLESALTIDKLERGVSFYKKIIDNINKHADSEIVGVFFINYSNLKNTLINTCHSKINHLLKSGFEFNNKKLHKLEEDSNAIEELDALEHNSITECLAALHACSTLLSDIQAAEVHLQELEQSFGVLQNYSYTIPNDVTLKINELLDNRTKMENLVQDKIVKIKLALDVFKKSLSVKSEEIKLEIINANLEMQLYLPTELEIGTVNSFTIINRLSEMLDDIKTKMKINENLSIVSLNEIEFPELIQHLSNLFSAKKLWLLIENWQVEWQKWREFSCWDVSVISFHAMLESFQSSLNDVTQRACVSDSDDGPASSAEPQWGIQLMLQAYIADALKLVPLLNSLQEAKFQEHHWKEIKAILSKDFDENSVIFSIGFIYDVNLTYYSREIIALANKSITEFMLFNKLEEIQNQTKMIKLKAFDTPADGGAFAGHSITEANSEISHLILELRKLCCSKYICNHLKRVNEIERQLDSLFELLEELYAVQKLLNRWIPFFFAHDVRCHLIHATTIFDACYQAWKQITQTINKEQFICRMVTDEKCFLTVTEIKRSLKKLPRYATDYFQDIRETNPRFHFLSDDDIITITSQVCDTENMRPFYFKLFSNVSMIKTLKNMSVGGTEAVSVVSPDGETVDLISHPLITGPVSSWLTRVQQAITHSLREHVKQCKANQKAIGSKLDELLKIYPLQVCSITVQSVLSTELIKCKSRSQASQDIINSQEKYLKDVMYRFGRILTSSTQKNFREKVRLFYSTILFLRDQLIRFKENKNDKAPTESDPPFLYNTNKDTGQLTLSIGPYSRTYGWEYQGLRTLPAMTSSIRRHIGQVLHNMNQGFVSCAVGNHATGKTETIKTISFISGCNLVIIECNPNMTVRFITRMLLGSLQTPSALLIENSQVLSPPLIPILSELLLSWHKIKKVSFQSKDNRQLKTFNGLPVEFNELSSIAVELTGVQLESRFILSTLQSSSKSVTFFPASWKVSIIVTKKNHFTLYILFTFYILFT